MTGLFRKIRLRSAIAIVIGGIIGSGIFMKPSAMASLLGSPMLLVSLWLVAGVMTLFGALSNAEAATMFPETGGTYVFFQKMYGRAFAFLYGWASLTVINTAGNASIAYVCSQYTNYFITLPRLDFQVEENFVLHIPFIGNLYLLKDIGVKLLTILILTFLTALNYISVNKGAGLQRILTALKVVGILFLITGLFTSGKGDFATVMDIETPLQGWSLFSAYIAGLSGAFWAYDGWNNITFVAGEIQNPQKTIPRSLLTGILCCIVIYVLINLAFFSVLSVDEIASSPFVASTAASAVWGGLAGGLIALLVIFSTLGAANANVLSTARVTFAMSRENKWFKKAGRVHPTFCTPGNALILNLIWSSVLIFSGSFDVLTDMLIFVSWFFYGASSLGIIVLRIKFKDLHRPYKVWGYPFIPAAFVIFTVIFLCSTVYTDVQNYHCGNSPVINSIFGMALTLLGIPVYFLSGKTSGEKTPPKPEI